MSYTRIYSRTPDLPEFEKWLIDQGHDVYELMTDYEILRVCIREPEGDNGIESAYRNKKGRESWPRDLRSLYHQFRSGRLKAVG